MTYRDLENLMGRFALAVADTGHGTPSDFAKERPDLLTADEARAIETAMNRAERAQALEAAE